MTQGISFIVSDLISKAQLQEAAVTIQQFLKGKNRPDLEDAATMALMQLNKLANDYHVLQILSDDEAQRIHNQIGVALLALLKEVKTFEKSTQQQQSSLRDPAIEGLVYAHMHAMLEKDLDGIMKTFHPEMPALQDTKALYEQIFQNMDAIPEVRSIRLLTRGEDIATAEVVQFTQSKIENVPFRENETTQIYLFRKYNGLWKIFNTLLKKLEYFDLSDEDVAAVS